MTQEVRNAMAFKLTKYIDKVIDFDVCKIEIIPEDTLLQLANITNLGLALDLGPRHWVVNFGLCVTNPRLRKSTFINYVANYFRKGTLTDLKVAIPTKHRPIPTEAFVYCENNVSDVAQSKTDSCNHYLFIDSRTNKEYLFLDTPGMSDTRGVQQDEINMERILNAVELLGGLTVIIIVINGTTGRMTSTIKNVIVKLRSNLPNAILDTVIVAFTNGKQHEVNFDLNCLDLQAGKIHPFYFQNSAFSSDPSRWNERALKHLQVDWEDSMDEFTRMIQLINECSPKAITAFTDMKNIRNTIRSLFHKARLEVTKIQKMQDEIAALQQGVSDFDSVRQLNKNYVQKKTVDNVEQIPCSHYNTVCTVCTEVCHNECSLTETTTVGDQIFERCSAMENGTCTVCKNKCSYEKHYHARVTFRHVKKSIEDVLHDIKAKYDQAGAKKSAAQQEIMTIADAKKVLETALNKMNGEIKQLCLNLKGICSGFNLVDELYAMINQLQIEAQSLTSIDARKNAEDFIRSLIGFCEQMETDPRFQARSGQAKVTIVDYHPPSNISHNRFLTKTAHTKPSQSSVSTQQYTDQEGNSFDLISIETMLRKLLMPILTDQSQSKYKTACDNSDDYHDQRPRPRQHRTRNRNPTIYSDNKKKHCQERSQKHQNRTPSVSSDETSSDKSFRSGSEEYSLDDRHPRHRFTQLTTKSTNKIQRHRKQHRQDTVTYNDFSHQSSPSVQHQSFQAMNSFTRDNLRQIYTDNLIGMQHQAQLQQNGQNFTLVSDELDKRMQGKTTGPLTEEDQDLYFIYIRKYERKDQATLAKDYRALQQQIHAIFESNITPIPHYLLLQCAAIYKLQKESTQIAERQNSFVVDLAPCRDIQSPEQVRKQSDSKSYIVSSSMMSPQSKSATCETRAVKDNTFADIDVNSMQTTCLNRLTALYFHVITTQNEILCGTVKAELEKFGRETNKKAITIINNLFEKTIEILSSQSVEELQTLFDNQKETIVNQVSTHMADSMTHEDSIIHAACIYYLIENQPPLVIKPIGTIDMIEHIGGHSLLIILRHQEFSQKLLQTECNSSGTRRTHLNADQQSFDVY
ncbi:hypothetical protein I4U23_027221 [Adineta vaga]|nr:hypothetical protein I4U23_027221 [Adineta vaga]